MKLSALEINNFRNLTQVNLFPSAKINIFFGNNGSGKTSILEAIHYLGLGRSFRTRNVRRLINHHANSFSLIGHLASDKEVITVGVERKIEQATIKIAGEPASSLVQLAKLIPLQLINADSHLLLTTGSVTRRQFLDWGTFHVEPLFFTHWQRANRILKQRNASLKLNQKYNEIAIWDAELESSAIWLDNARRLYLDEFKALCTPILINLLSRDDLSFSYSAGWNTDNSLKETLFASFNRDLQMGYTHYGPHRADLQLKFKNVPAVEVLSQGQQKLAAYAMRIAQGVLLQQIGKSCVFLIDDLPSELDQERREQVIKLILTLNSQIFVTGIEAEALTNLQSSATSVFHVEQGTISHR